MFSDANRSNPSVDQNVQKTDDRDLSQPVYDKSWEDFQVSQVVRSWQIILFLNRYRRHLKSAKRRGATSFINTPPLLRSMTFHIDRHGTKFLKTQDSRFFGSNVATLKNLLSSYLFNFIPSTLGNAAQKLGLGDLGSALPQKFPILLYSSYNIATITLLNISTFFFFFHRSFHSMERCLRKLNTISKFRTWKIQNALCASILINLRI